MKALRISLAILAAVLALGLIAAGLAFNSRVQTWAVHHVLAKRPERGISIGTVSAGLSGVELTNVRIERDGMVLALPAVEADISVLPAAFGHNLALRRLVARGWTLEPARAGGAALAGIGQKLLGTAAAAAKRSVGDSGPSFIASASAGEVAIPPAAVFQGILNRCELPFDFSLDAVELEGDVAVPGPGGAPAGRAHVTVSGGGLGAGGEGRFIFNLTSTPADAGAPVASLVADGAATVAMDTPRTITYLVVELKATATGPQFPKGVKLDATIGATRSPAGESYSVALATDSRPLASVQADFPLAGGRLDGSWQFDVGDDDLAPFLLGRRLPVFSMVGNGHFEADAAFAEVHASGSLNVTADRLAWLRPELAGVAAVRLTTEFDLTRSGNTLRADRFTAALSGAHPILTVEGLQAFAFDTGTGELTVADAASDVLDFKLANVPVGWAQPFFSGVVLTGGDVRGEFVAGARGGGLSIHSTAPVQIVGFSATKGGQPLVGGLDVSLESSATYTGEGWEVEVQNAASSAIVPPRTTAEPPSVIPAAPNMASDASSAVVPGGTMAEASRPSFDAKFGQLSGRNQPIKVVGHWSGGLPGLLRTLGAGGARGSHLADSVNGDVRCDFTASLAARKSVEAKLSFANLAAGDAAALTPLPAITADVRADFGSDGKVAFNAPLIFDGGAHQSDLTVVGTLTGTPDGFGVDGQVTSARLFLGDIKALAGLVALRGQNGGGAAVLRTAEGDTGVPPPADSNLGGTPVPPTPFWHGITGRLTLALKDVTAGQFGATDFSGTLAFAPDSLGFEGWHADVKGGGEVKIGGGLAFADAVSAPYELKLDLTAANFDPGPALRTLNPGRAPIVDGKFDIDARISGRGADPAAAVTDAQGDFKFASKGGTLRALTTGISPKAASSGKIAAIGSLIGDLAGAVIGRKDADAIVTKAQAVVELAGKISAIPYDQMSFGVARDASQNVVLQDFALISPEIRMQGGGQVTHEDGVRLLDRPLTLDFKLLARGHTADLLKIAGLLDTHPDDLGYSACTIPLKVGGTLAKPDTSDLQSTLMKTAYDHSGVGDLLDKLLGK